VEQIAALAGVAPGTVYNRFGTKGALAAVLLRDRMREVFEAPRRDLEAGRSVPDAIRRHLRRLGRALESDLALTEAFILALVEASRGRRPPTGPTDPRTVLPLPQPLVELMSEGQRRGEVRADIDADDVARSLTSFLCLRFLSHREPGEASGAFLADLALHGILVSGIEGAGP
jgi:AcrR family transcriptional regulator